LTLREEEIRASRELEVESAVPPEKLPTEQPEEEGIASVVAVACKTEELGDSKNGEDKDDSVEGEGKEVVDAVAEWMLAADKPEEAR